MGTFAAHRLLQAERLEAACPPLVEKELATNSSANNTFVSCVLGSEDTQPL